MKKIIYKILHVLLLSILIIACSEIKLEEENTDKYTISLGEFKTYEEADIFKSKIDFQLWNELKIEQADQSRFVLVYGNYNSSFEAGQKAFELLNNSLINNYKVVKNNNNVNDPFSNILFLAKYQSRPSVYKYNLLKEQSKLLWSRWGRKVLSLNLADDRGSVFIVTALGYGKQGSFPYVRDARLYIYRAEKDQIDEVAEFGDGIQVYSYWENKDTFKVNITKPDSIRTEKIIQTIYGFDKLGKKTQTSTREFILTKDGFPKPPNSKLPLYSSNGTYQLRITEERNEKSIYLRDQKKRAELLIVEINGEIKNLQWSPDENYLFLILNHSNKNKSAGKSELLIINTSEKTIKRNFTGPIYKNLLVQGNLLFFDQQYEGISQITIYDFVTDIIFDEIRIPGGCGINDLNF